MHFVPFPSLTEAERFAGLLPIDLSQVRHGPDEATAANAVSRPRRIRLLQRVDGPVYIAAGASKPLARHASDLSDASVKSGPLALAIVREHARERGIDASHAGLARVADYDQWSVPSEFDKYRPLYRVALNDAAGAEFYVSSTTGEVVLATTREERVWNYAGSVVHWIYPTGLRKHPATWKKVVWTLSLIALITAIAGTVLGVARLRISDGRAQSPFRGWHAWHHVLGLFTATFVLSWIFSGWLSMDHGLLFSRGQLSAAEAANIAATTSWSVLAGDQRSIAAPVKEVEWFAFGDRFYRRERASLNSQSIFAVRSSQKAQPFLSAGEVEAAVRRITPDCAAPAIVGPHDSYPMNSLMTAAPVYRSICGDVWFHIDGATGAMLERSDSSRRSYRWLYSGLHTLDFPVLLDHPLLRTTLIVLLCTLGIVFSMTGAVIGWRRLRLQFGSRSEPI
jgi:uncharacterized iron-regulated membrane protein